MQRKVLANFGSLEFLGEIFIGIDGNHLLFWGSLKNAVTLLIRY
jgi:hypothetical protein